MASEAEYTSDSDDGNTTKIFDEHLKYLKEKIVQYILETDDFAAEIKHEPGKRAKLVMTFGSLPVSSSSTPRPRTTNTVLVRNIPDSVDKEYLEMFFEHTKRQGGRPVKHIEFHKDHSFAIIEFEEADSVQNVLKKLPINIQGTTVTVEAYTPYLEGGVKLESIEICGLPAHLTKDIAEMKVVGLKQSASVSSRRSFAMPTIETAKLVHPGVSCDGCGMKAITGSRFNCESCFPDFNFCSVCKSTKRHNPSHAFTQLEAGNYPFNFIHVNFRCDGCHMKPIYGSRFRCKDCPSFDYCAACMTNRATTHDSTHTFIKL